MLEAGTHVEVRGGFVGSWSRGFEIVECVHDRYVVRRQSDRSVLPAHFPERDVRRAD